MLNDNSLPAIAAVRTGSDVTTEPRLPAVSEPPTLIAPVPAPSPIANPTLRLDAGLGLVVIEFRNDNGAITTSIPSQRQLAAYQRWETTRLGPAPAGRTQSAAAIPSQPRIPASDQIAPAPQSAGADAATVRDAHPKPAAQHDTTVAVNSTT